MYAAMLTRLALRRELHATLAPVPRPLGFDLQQRFDACLCLAVLNLLDAGQQAALFSYVRAHVADDGVFVLEEPVPSRLRTEIAHQLKAERTFGQTRYQHFYSMRTSVGGRWCTTWEFLTWRGETLLERCTRKFDWKPASVEEVQAMAKAAGLRIEETFGGFDRTPFVEGESRVLCAVLRPVR